MCSKKWYLKRNISCDVHLLNELLETDVPWDDAIVVWAGKMWKLWDSLSELRTSLCERRLERIVLKPALLPVKTAQFTQFNWECTAPTTLPPPLYIHTLIHHTPYTCTYGGAVKTLARPTSRCILFDGENISFGASLVTYIYIYIYIYIHIYITNIPQIIIVTRIYESQNLPGRAKDLSATPVLNYNACIFFTNIFLMNGL